MESKHSSSPNDAFETSFVAETTNLIPIDEYENDNYTRTRLEYEGGQEQETEFSQRELAKDD